MHAGDVEWAAVGTPQHHLPLRTASAMPKARRRRCGSSSSRPSGCSPTGGRRLVISNTTIFWTAGSRSGSMNERAVTGLRGLDQAAVGAWLVDHVDGIVAPVTFALIAGGHSNLTYLRYRRRRP